MAIMSPKPAHGSINLGEPTSSTRRITEAVMELYDRIVDRELLVRRMYVVANHAVPADSLKEAFLEHIEDYKQVLVDFLDAHPEYVFVSYKEHVIDTEGNEVHITTEIEDTSEVVLTLVNAGVRVYEMRNESINLEDFFIERLG